MFAANTISTPSGNQAKVLARVGRAKKLVLFAYIAPVLLFLICGFVFPVLRFLLLSVYDRTFTLAQYQKLLDSPVYARIIWETFKITAWTTFFSLLLGYPVAYAVANVGPRLRTIMLVLIVVPFWTNVLVRMYAWLILLGTNGVINKALIAIGLVKEPLPLLFNRFAVVLAMVHVMLPYMIFPLYSVMSGIPKEIKRAAASLGAGPYRHLLHIYLPLSLPGVGAGCILVFILSMGFYITPALVGGRSDVMLSMLIEMQISEALNWPFGAALSVVLVVITLVFYAVYSLILNPTKIYDVKT
jgi:ABC-type spermidine/putrescine transport system permease subunit I